MTTLAYPHVVVEYTVRGMRLQVHAMNNRWAGFLYPKWRLLWRGFLICLLVASATGLATPNRHSHLDYVD